MKKSDSIVEIAKALAEFRKDLKQPAKDANNPFFKSKYTTLDKVIEAIDETAPKHDLSFTQWAVSNEQGNVGVETLLLHSSGEFIHYDALYMKPEKNTPQSAGSVISYLRRYTISAIFGITSDEDDDGNQASNAGSKQQSNQRQSYNQQPKMNENNKQLPMQDKGKVEVVKQNAKDLADVLNAQDDADEDNQATEDSILKAYLKGRALKDVSNEDLIHLSKSIKSKIQQYSSK